MLARYQDIESAIHTYFLAIEQIKKSYAELAKTEALLQESFQSSDTWFRIRGTHTAIYWDRPEIAIRYLNRDFWMVLADRLKLRAVLSPQAFVQFERQVKRDEFPEITIENVRLFLEKLYQHADQYIQESMQHVYRYLGQAKRKAIIKGVVTKTLQGWSVNEDHRQDLLALERVFILLSDSTTKPPHHQSELQITIEGSPRNHGETEFFRYKVYKKGSLHLTIKDLEILRRIQHVALGEKPPLDLYYS